MPPAETAVERAEELVDRVLGDRTPRLRMLVIVNPYATTVSDRLKNLVVYALQARYAVEAVETQAPDHATDLCRQAADAGYDVVVAFGGDGTVNEAANGLVGSQTALSCLPGGATNVFCRILGIPNDVVDATEHLLAIADRFEPYQVDAARVNDRYFVFSSGVGLDASVVERVDRHPRLKARAGEWFYAYAAVSTFSRRYLVGPPRVRVEVGDRVIDGVTLVVQNADPFTYFGARPVRVCEGAGLDAGSISLAVLTRATPLELATLTPRLLSTRARTVQRHRRIKGFAGVAEVRVTALGEETFPVEVDGDHIGELREAAYSVAPGALRVVA